MKKVIAIFLCTVMALSMAACAGNPNADSSESVTSNSVPEDKSEMVTPESEVPKGDVIEEDPNQMISPEDATKKDVPPTQVESLAEDAKFIFQFAEPVKDASSDAELWVQTLSEKEIGLVVGYAGPKTQGQFFPDGMPEVKMEKYPEILNSVIVSTLSMTEKYGVPIGDTNGKLTIEETDTQKTENKMSVTSFTGLYDSNTIREETLKGKVAGYCGKLDQNGFPIFVVAIDLSSDQSNADSIGQIALDCISSIEEVQPE